MKKKVLISVNSIILFLLLFSVNYAGVDVIKTEYFNQYGVIKYAPNGTVAMVFRKTISYTSYKLIYRIIHHDGTYTDDEIASGDSTRYFSSNHLVYDTFSRPHIITAYRGYASGNYFCNYDLYYKHNGQWIHEMLNITSPYLQYEAVTISHADNTIHIVGTTPGTSYKAGEFIVYYISNRSGNWFIQQIEQSTLDNSHLETGVERELPDLCIAADKQGYIHVVYGMAYKADLGDGYDFCSVLKYATNKTGVWVVENVFAPYYFFKSGKGYDPSLALNNDGTPYIASTYMQRSWTGGSLTKAELYFSYRTKPNTWTGSSIMKNSDGYNGNDGTNFTGALPQLIFDVNNYPHIIFLDYASYHLPYNYVYQGQIRYGYYNGSTWQFSKLFSQPSPNIIQDGVEITVNEIHEPSFALSQAGKELHIFAREYIKESQNQDGIYKNLHLYARNSFDIVKNAQFISQNVPNEMTAGNSYQVTVSMKNTGTEPWIADSQNPYRLGSQNPMDNNTWVNIGRVELPNGEGVAPDSIVNFVFNITAPSQVGQYNFQWQMVQDGVGWFGDLTQNILINVTEPQVNAIAIADYLLGKRDLSQTEFSIADKNNDSIINIADVVKAINGR